MRDSKNDSDGAARSLFLAALMIGSVLVGGLFYDFESDGINLAPIIENDIPNSILVGSMDNFEVYLEDEDMNSLDIEITLDGIAINVQPNVTGIVLIDISDIGVGVHALK